MTHYEQLGVLPNASQDEIKRAYRRLSLKLHPDKTSDPISIDKYKDVNEAYEILGDPSKRHRYDFELNHSSALPGFFPPPQFGNGGIRIFTTRGDMEHMMGDMEHMMGGMSGAGDPSIDLDHIFHILTGGSNMFNPGMHRVNKPPPISIPITITMDIVLNGASMPIKVDRWILGPGGLKISETETIYIDIPKGIDDNEIIVIKEKGNVVNETTVGDIKVTITINNDTNTKFTRDGLDLIYYHTITLKEALCGFTFELSHLSGKTYTINNKKGKIIHNNYTTVIQRLGISRNENIGNLKIVFTVEFPTVLTLNQIDAIENIL
jgi:DnaJ family protein B protein 4